MKVHVTVSSVTKSSFDSLVGLAHAVKTPSKELSSIALAILIDSLIASGSTAATLYSVPPLANFFVPVTTKAGTRPTETMSLDLIVNVLVDLVPPSPVRPTFDPRPRRAISCSAKDTLAFASSFSVVTTLITRRALNSVPTSNGGGLSDTVVAPPVMVDSWNASFALLAKLATFVATLFFCLTCGGGTYEASMNGLIVAHSGTLDFSFLATEQLTLFQLEYL